MSWTDLLQPFILSTVIECYPFILIFVDLDVKMYGVSLEASELLFRHYWTLADIFGLFSAMLNAAVSRC